MTGSEPAIRTRGLTRRFDKFVAVDDLDLDVERGTFLGFLGANGAGKSTTIKMLTGLIDLSGGSAEILGRDVVKDAVEAKRLIGVVPESLALHERLTAAEHLTFVGRMHDMDRKVIHQRQTELLERMNLHEDPGKLIVDFSQGMKKKLALAAALIHDPQVLFLDEPFEGIDVIASRMIRQLLVTLLSRGVTIFLTSHVLEIVEKLCTHVAIVHQGKLVANGSLEELRQGVHSRNPLTQGDDTPSVQTLEEIFLNIVDAGDQAINTLSWLG